MIDSHAHLDACPEPTDVLLRRAREAGVRGVVAVGAGIESCLRVLAIAEREEDVHAALGIDPHRARNGDAGRLDELGELLGRPEAVAVGETGLDYHHGADAKEEQRRLFEAQLALAADAGKPVVVHCRDAARDTASVLTAFEGIVVLHCFSEPPLYAAAAERGWYVSFAGNVTYPRSHELRRIVVDVAPDRILAETDSPYLAPLPRRGRPNEPANLVHTVALLADLRGEDRDEFAERVEENARTAFALA